MIVKIVMKIIVRKKHNLNIYSFYKKKREYIRMLFFICVVLKFFYAQTYSAYLFVYFTGNSGTEESIRYAYSDNGFEYVALNGDNPVISSSTIAATGAIRDPHIYRAVDGKTFYMVVTDMKSANGWSSNHGIVMLKSTNLIDWTYSRVDIRTAFSQFSNVTRVWAPQTIYDPDKKQYMVYFAMRSGSDAEVIYYSYANADFTALETVPKALYIPDDKSSCIDADIIYFNSSYHLFYKATTSSGSGIMKAVASTATGTYKLAANRFLQDTTDSVEGSCVFKLIDSDIYVLIYDLYTTGKYQFTESTDLLNFKVTTRRVSYDFTPRHGTVMTITAEEKAALLKKWG
jgi:predicted GH43/DUF377 family glycosyl hydrolase